MGGQILPDTYGERWTASNFGTSVPSHHLTRAYRHQTLALSEPLLVEKWSKTIVLVPQGSAYTQGNAPW
jgi:hypothetical protein